MPSGVSVNELFIVVVDRLIHQNQDNNNFVQYCGKICFYIEIFTGKRNFTTRNFSTRKPYDDKYSTTLSDKIHSCCNSRWSKICIGCIGYNEVEFRTSKYRGQITYEELVEII